MLQLGSVAMLMIVKVKIMVLKDPWFVCLSVHMSVCMYSCQKWASVPRRDGGFWDLKR